MTDMPRFSKLATSVRSPDGGVDSTTTEP